MDKNIAALLDCFMIIHHRKQIRLKKYDYSDTGWYFVTICTQNRKCLLGNVINNKIILNEFGKIVKKYWLEIPKHFDNVELDDYQIMLNHIHFVLIIVGADPRVRPLSKHIGSSLNIDLGSTQGSTPTVGEYIKRFKTLTTFIYINNVKYNNWEPFDKRIWQRNYYEHIIRNEYELNRIRQYIRDNPQNWENDRNNLLNKLEYKN